MAAFLLILGVPLLGALLSVAEHYRRSADTPSGRAVARGMVLAVGLLLGLIGMGLLLTVGVWVLAGVRDTSLLIAVLSFLAQVTASVLMLWTARCAIGVVRLSPSEGDPAAEIRAEHASEELRLASAAVALVPVLLVGVFGLFFAIPVLTWGGTHWASRRSQEAQLLWTLALAVRQELPLAEEIDAFADPLWSRRKRAYYSLSSRLRDGRTLGDALEMSSGILPRALTSELRMAEEAGTLSAVLTNMAVRSTASLSRTQFDRALATTLTYGWGLLATELAIVSFVMYWIIPRYIDIFHDFGVELPDLTVSAIRATNMFIDNLLIVLPLFGLPVLAVFAWVIAYFVGWSNLNLPLLMRWFPRRDAPSLLRSLSHAVGAAQPLPEMIDEMSHRHLRSDMRQRLARIGRSLEFGSPLWRPLCEEGFIRAKEADALAAAQRANNLPWAMRTLADAIERTGRHRTQFCLELVKPVLVVSIGLFVGWFVIAMFLPLVTLITQMSQSS